MPASANRAFEIAVVAAASCSPFTVGTVDGCSPCDSTRDTVEPGWSSVPAFGWVAVTSPTAFVLQALVAGPMRNPLECSAAIAASWFSPVRLGIAEVDPGPPP